MSFAESSFHQAVSAGDAHAVSAMLARGADVNAQNENGHTPVIHAIAAGQFHLLPLLINAGANPTLLDNTGLSAIDWAERKGRPDLAAALRKPPTKTAPVDPKEQRNDNRSGDEPQRQPISPDEKSRRFIAGLRQRLEEKANREATDDQRQANDEETPQEPRPTARGSGARTETIVEPTREASPAVPQRPENPLPPKREVAPAAPQRPENPLPAKREVAPAPPQRPENPLPPKREVAPAPPQRPENPLPPKREVAPASPRRPENPLPPKREVAPAAPQKPHNPVVSETDVRTLRSSSPLSSPPVAESRSSSHRKRCPQCGATYNSELLAYCVYHEVALVSADEPIPTSPAENRSSLLWILVVISMAVGGAGGLIVTSDLFKDKTVNNPAAAVSSPITQKGIPTLEKHLAGKEVSLPEAEVPANTVKERTTITVRVRIDREGRVSPTSATGGDQVLRDAVTQAARKATFSVKKLTGRGAQGTISYTFN